MLRISLAVLSTTLGNTQMKKSLLALAVLGAFTGIASAQTSVTIYGVADAGITREDNGSGHLFRLDSGNQSGSRLGFKGNEDLGGGLSAQFLLEQGFNIDNGSATDVNRTAFNRQAYLGLTGAFGQIRLGRQKSVMYDTLTAIDPFGIADKGGIDRLFMKNLGAARLRTDNTVAYFTPNLSGFTGQVTGSFGEVPQQTPAGVNIPGGGSRAGRQFGVSLNYAAGPLFVTLDHSSVRNAPVIGAPAVPAFVSDTAKGSLLGATYDFGVVKAHGAFGIERGIGNVNNHDYMLGATIPFGASAVQLDYIRKDDRSNANNQGAKQYAVGYTYALSKRTNFYSSYTRTQQDAAASYVGLTGQTDKVLNAGIRHTF
jgi:predicted porin